MITFLDARALIYLIEGKQPFAGKVHLFASEDRAFRRVGRRNVRVLA